MNMIIIFGVCLIHQTSAIQTNFKTYKSLKGIKAHLNVSRVTKAGSVEQCVILCSNAGGYARANFHGSTCEILDVVPGRRDIELVEDQDSMYICKCSKI